MKKSNPTAMPPGTPKVVSGKPSSLTTEPVRPGSFLMKGARYIPPPGRIPASSSRGEISQDEALRQVASGLATVIENRLCWEGNQTWLLWVEMWIGQGLNA